MAADADLIYFALLGVSEDASQEELEARYRELADHFASPAIPAHLREWARRQAALVDEAYAVLSDPERRTGRGEQQRPAEARESQAKQVQKPEPEAQAESRDEERPAQAARSVRRTSKQPEPAAGVLLAGLQNLRSQPLVLGALVGLLLLGAILLGRYGFPDGGEETTGPVDENVAVPLDMDRIAELMTALQQDPENPDILFELGERYFQANEWQSAIDWFTELLAVDPSNTHARTDIGTAHFNLGRPDQAKEAWLGVLEIDPNDVQVHYNLGFLYANVEPPDLALARQEWQTVVELAPESELAQTAQVHLDGLPEEAHASTP